LQYGVVGTRSSVASAAATAFVGTRPTRFEIPGIVTGSYTHIQNVHVPGMLHGRIVRPRGQAVFGFEHPIVSVDESSTKQIPNVPIVRKNDFLGVVAANEYDAIQVAALLNVKWADPPAVLSGNGNEFERMRALDSAGKTVWRNASFGNTATSSGDVEKGLAAAAHVVKHRANDRTRRSQPTGIGRSPPTRADLRLYDMPSPRR
jgi:hypothetical protein